MTEDKFTHLVDNFNHNTETRWRAKWFSKELDQAISNGDKIGDFYYFMNDGYRPRVYICIPVDLKEDEVRPMVARFKANACTLFDNPTFKRVSYNKTNYYENSIPCW